MKSLKIPIDQISDLEFDAGTKAISFAWQGQKYWYYAGVDNSGDKSSGLLLLRELRESKGLVLDATPEAVNGSHIVSNMVLQTTPILPPPPPLVPLEGVLAVGLLAIAILFVLAVRFRRKAGGA